MSLRRTRHVLTAVAIATATLLSLTASAATPVPAHLAPNGAVGRRARASLGLSAGRTAGWVGQPVPVTVTAVFRDVEGVTLEGTPTLTSKAVITSELAKEPRQSTEIIDGERMLVARWTGTVTPSTSGPLDLTAELPVQLKYREAVAHVARPALPEDPLGDFGGDDDIDSLFAQMRKRMTQAMSVEDVGRLHEENIGLKASLAPLDVRAIPTTGQPASFSGAVGAFDIAAKLEAATAAVSEPITLRIEVGGDVDPDRVEVAGIPSSATWKAYPPHALAPPALDGGVTRAKSAKKVFEQVLVPLQGGDLTVPPVSFTAFDPATGTYVTHATQPLEITVSGTVASPPAAAVAPPVPPRPIDLAPARTAVLFAGLAALVLVLAAAAMRLIRRRRPDRELRDSMRTAAAAGNAASFLSAAHALVAARLAERWDVPPGDVTASAVRERLGAAGEPLAEVLVADAALRFGRGGLEGADLGALAHQVEQSLRATSAMR